jgi:hypothetical protein
LVLLNGNLAANAVTVKRASESERAVSFISSERKDGERRTKKKKKRSVKRKEGSKRTQL